MDEKLARGMVRADSRQVASIVDDGGKAVVDLIVGEMNAGRFPIQDRKVRPHELQALMRKIDALIDAPTTVACTALERPATGFKAKTRGNIYLREWICAEQGGTGGIYSVRGQRVVADCRRVKTRETWSCICIVGHAVQRALERRGIENPGVYDAARSPIAAAAKAFVDNAGLAALYMLAASRGNWIDTRDILLPGLGGLWLGCAYVMLEERMLNDEGLQQEIAHDCIFGASIRMQPFHRHPLFGDAPMGGLQLETFVHDYGLFDNQRTIKRDLEAFAQQHAAPLDDLSKKLFWRDEIDTSAAEALLPEFLAIIADTPQRKADAPAEQRQHEMA